MTGRRDVGHVFHTGLLATIPRAIPIPIPYDIEIMALFRKRTKPIKLRSMEQLEELARSGQPLFVDFWQHNNPQCRKMEGIIGELADEFAGDAIVVRADITRVPDVFEKFKVKSTPTFMVVTGSDSSSGVDLKWRAGGLIKKDQLIHQLESAVSKS